MSRPFNPDLTKYWKICLPATLAGTVEFYLMDSIHKKPRYGSRAKLITDLLEGWVKEQQAEATLVPRLDAPYTCPICGGNSVAYLDCSTPMCPDGRDRK